MVAGLWIATGGKILRYSLIFWSNQVGGSSVVLVAGIGVAHTIISGLI